MEQSSVTVIIDERKHKLELLNRAKNVITEKIFIP